MSSRYDEDDDLNDLRRSSRRRRRANECPFCGCINEPIAKQQISQAGWITFAVLIAFCWPLCWIGLLMNEDYLACGDCGRKLD